MADKEVDEKARTLKLARAVVGVFASTMDALLQEWLEKGEADDRLGMAIVSARLAQAGHMLTYHFKGIGEGLLDGDTEVKAANQAVQQTGEMLQRALKVAAGGAVGARPISEQVSAKGSTSIN